MNINNEVMKTNNDFINNIDIEYKKNMNNLPFIIVSFCYTNISKNTNIISFEIPYKYFGINFNNFLKKIINEMIEYNLIDKNHFNNILNILNKKIQIVFDNNSTSKNIGRFKVTNWI